MAKKRDESEAAQAARRERFRRVAVKRTRAAVLALDRLSRCAGKGSYSYSAEEAAKVLTAVDQACERLRRRFAGSPAQEEFSL